MTRTLIALTVAVCLVLAATAGPQSAQAPTASGVSPSDSLVREAFAAAYNLDHETAMAHARRAIAADPQSPRAHRALASIVWLNILFHRGAVTVDHYMGSLTKTQLHLPKPDPAAATEFKAAIGKAIDLATAKLRMNARDVQARYDAGAAYGLQASYVASVEGSLSSAFGIARRAYSAQDDVLERDPSRVSAGLVVGTYRYLVSTMSMPKRWLAHLVGFGGDKAKGIALLEGALKDPEARVDAASALMLIYSREGRHPDVMRLARELSRDYPRNRLFVLEEGSAAIRAGRHSEAEAALTRGYEASQKETRPRIPGEEALWLYKRAMSRTYRNLTAAASADVERALAAKPTEWIRGRLLVERGKLADLAGRRPEAIADYTSAAAICRPIADTQCEKEAGDLRRKPFSLTGR
jgi:tetratricopeptide (TPR) repeat protein